MAAFKDGCWDADVWDADVWDPDVDFIGGALASDTFARGDSTALGSTDGGFGGGSGIDWTEGTEGGDLRITSEKMDASGGANSAVVDASESDVVVTGTVTAGTVGSFGIVARQTDSNNYWLFGLDVPGTFRLREKNGGGFTDRASTSVTVTTGVDYDLVATVNGTDHTGTVDGANEITYDSAAAEHNTTATAHGVRLYEAAGTTWKLDQFKVEAV